MTVRKGTVPNPYNQKRIKSISGSSLECEFPMLIPSMGFTYIYLYIDPIENQPNLGKWLPVPWMLWNGYLTTQRFFFLQPGWNLTLRCAHGRPTVYPLASLAQLENRGLGHKWTWLEEIHRCGWRCLFNIYIYERPTPPALEKTVKTLFEEHPQDRKHIWWKKLSAVWSR